ncbi:hypothetical protein NDU88_004658 [Pleurodeles waltl]|uniref:Uncharacterized protein n=1 Tax=Pleurodeles waltl TaxID=8319 RepID=A0AAV7V1S8_PLEWA|nr:hypothetical protein NDU88_004658 [Pleurodeles waltl]
MPERKSGAFRVVCEEGAGEDHLMLDCDEDSEKWKEVEQRDEEEVGVPEMRQPGRGEAVGVFQRSSADNGNTTGKQARASSGRHKDRGMYRGSL